MYFCIYFVICEGLVYGDWQIIHDQVSFYQVRHAELNIIMQVVGLKENENFLSFWFNQQNVCSMIKCIGSNCF